MSAHQGHGDAVDMDGDGYFDLDSPCSETDCDDTDAMVNPEVTEIQYNGIDDDCDPLTLDDDLDEDGYNNDVDCDDTNTDVNPAMEEVCENGIDDNCNGEIDENCAPEIGDFTQGGIVFYIASTPTDLDGNGTLDIGLVCAIEDQSSGIQWYNGSYIITGATGNNIGTGFANTEAIIAVQGPTATSYAAGLADAYSGGGFTDWFLPSKDELKEMYINRVIINAAATTNGGGIFSTYLYWSSTEVTNYYAARQFFFNGNQFKYHKGDTSYVRAVRAF